MIPDPRAHPTLTVQEAGRLLGLSRNRAYESAAAGDFPVLRFGRALRVPTAQLLALLGLHPENEDGEQLH